MSVKLLSEIVDEIEHARGQREQVALLRQYSSPQLKKVIGFAMDPAVKWLLGEGAPEYTPLKANTDTEGRLYYELRKLNYFIDCPEGKGIKPVRREQLFIEILESIDPNDAKLLIRVKDRALSIKKAAVKEAFPGISKEW